MKVDLVQSGVTQTRFHPAAGRSAECIGVIIGPLAGIRTLEILPLIRFVKRSGTGGGFRGSTW
jgi:hypothetical protein